MHGRMDEGREGWMDVTMYVCMHAWMHGGMDVSMYVCMHGWMDGWMEGCTYRCLHTTARIQ